MPARKLPRNQVHPYGHAYQQARKALLASNPTCYWCPEPATTADHEPPVEVAGPHLNLVPACTRCNYGRRGRVLQPRRPYPEPSRPW